MKNPPSLETSEFRLSAALLTNFFLVSSFLWFESEIILELPQIGHVLNLEPYFRLILLSQFGQVTLADFLPYPILRIFLKFK